MGKKKALISIEHQGYLTNANAIRMRVELFNKLYADKYDKRPLADPNMKKRPWLTEPEIVLAVEEAVGVARVTSKMYSRIRRVAKKKRSILYQDYDGLIMNVLGRKEIPAGLDAYAKEILNMDFTDTYPRLNEK